MPTAVPSDPLTLHLKAARRRSIEATCADAVAIALPIAAAAFVAIRYAGYPAAWTFTVALAVSGAITWKRRPALLSVAQRLDADSQSAELFSTAWQMNGDGDEWAQMLVAQANQQIEAATQRQPWPGMAAGLRGSLVLTAGALTACGLLIRPAEMDSGPAVAAKPAISQSETVQAAAWLTPQSRRQITDDPDENGRSIPMSQARTSAKPRQAGDDSRGGGRADAAEKAQTSLDGSREKVGDDSAGSRSGSRSRSNGSGTASLAAGGETAYASGTVHADAHATGQRDLPLGDIAPPPGSAASDRPIDPRYRDFIRDYFAR